MIGLFFDILKFSWSPCKSLVVIRVLYLSSETLGFSGNLSEILSVSQSN